MAYLQHFEKMLRQDIASGDIKKAIWRAKSRVVSAYYQGVEDGLAADDTLKHKLAEFKAKRKKDNGE